MSVSNLLKCVQGQPENLIFFGIEDFRVALNYRSRFSETDVARIIAELLVRYSRSFDQHIESILFSVLSAKALGEFKALITCGAVYAYKENYFSGQSTLYERTFAILREQFRYFVCDADGLIPVCRQAMNDAILIPFSFISRNKDHYVVDLDGNEIPEWSQAVKSLQETVDWGCAVQLHCRLGSNLINKVEGQSLQFPVLLGYWRKEKWIPSFPVQRLIATGAIQDGNLSSVKIHGKHKQIIADNKDAWFLCPENDTEVIDLNERGKVEILPQGLTIAELKEYCIAFIERKNLGKLGVKEILEKISKLEITVRKLEMGQWDRVIDLLETYNQHVDPDAYPQEHLQLLMLISAAFCHKGATHEAKAMNAKAKDFAQRIGCEDELIRLQIEELVLFQDLEKFEAAQMLAGTLSGKINAIKNNDLLMSFHGTQGQLESYGTLSGLPGFSKEKALYHFQRAIYHAGQLPHREQEMSQDLNYRHLWYALFAPGTPEEEENHLRALTYIHDQVPQAMKEKNQNYLIRQRGMAIYRRILLGDTCSTLDPKDFYPTANAENWILALRGKYLGTWHAANGNFDLALKEFDDGASKIELTGNLMILQFIGMTVLAQAYKSFRDNGLQEQAEIYRRRAFECFAANNDFKSYRNSEKWLDYLTNKSDYIPGLEYWY